MDVKQVGNVTYNAKENMELPSRDEVVSYDERRQLS